jgi:hypothetical protein
MYKIVLQSSMMLMFGLLKLESMEQVLKSFQVGEVPEEAGNSQTD